MSNGLRDKRFHPSAQLSAFSSQHSAFTFSNRNLPTCHPERGLQPESKDPYPTITCATQPPYRQSPILDQLPTANC